MTDSRGPRCPDTPSLPTATADPLCARLDELRELHRGARRTVTLASLLIVAQVAAFGVLTYAKVQTNFSADRVRGETQRIAEQLAPKAGETLLEVMVEVAPTYRELALERLRQSGPALAREFESQFQGIPFALEQELDRALRHVLHEAVVRLEPRIDRAFPGYEGPQGALRLAEDVHARLTAQSDLVLDHARARFRRDAQRIGQAVAALLDSTPGGDPATLERQWVHHLLMYIDHELMRDISPVPARSARPAAPTAALAQQSSRRRNIP
jgi:hypothetical protein